MDYTEKPEYGRVISICTAASQRELTTPALLAVLSPVIVGFGINYIALGAFLTGTILTGQLMANFLSNSGGALTTPRSTSRTAISAARGPSRTRRPSSVTPSVTRSRTQQARR